MTFFLVQKSIERELVCPMEEVDQAYGYIAYRKSVNSGKKLVITKARDYVLVSCYELIVFGMISYNQQM